MAEVEGELVHEVGTDRAKEKPKGGWGHTVLTLYVLQELHGRNKSEALEKILNDLIGIFGIQGAYRIMRGGFLELRAKEWMRRGLITRDDSGRYNLTEKGAKLLEEGKKLMRVMLREEGQI